MKRSRRTLADFSASGTFRRLSATERNTVVSFVADESRRKRYPEPVLSPLTGVVSDWLGIARLAQEYERGGWVFRGQPHPYALRPKIFRENTRRGPSGMAGPAHSIEDERRIFEQFVRGSRPYLEHTPGGKLEWLAIAQHHGLPTRLLDWSESFLAAVYFAVEKAGVGGFPAIYAFRHGAFPVVASPRADPFKLKRVSTYWPPHIASRIPAQQALFTIHPKPNAKFEPATLEQWLIARPACFKIKKQLRVCGMTKSVLFPGIDGLAAHLSWVYKWPKAME